MYMYSQLLSCFLPVRSVPRALNPSLVAFVNKKTYLLKSSGLLKVTVFNLSARIFKFQSYKSINVSGRRNPEIIQNCPQN